MVRKAFPLFLVLCLLLGLMAGCGGSAAPASEPAGSASASAAEEATEAEAPAEEAPAEAEPAAEEVVSAEEPAEEPEVQAPTNDFYSEHIGVVDYDLPLFDGEGYEFSIYWVKLGAMGGAEQPDKKDLLF